MRIPTALILVALLGWVAYPGDVVAVDLDKPLERTLGGGETHRYPLSLEAGTYLEGVIEQQGIDVAVRLLDPDGAAVFEMDSPNGAVGPEPLAIVATKTGAHVLEIGSSDPSAATGTYRLLFEILRVASEKDRIRCRAEQETARAAILAWRGQPETLQSAVRIYERTLEQWKQIGDRKRQAETLVRIGHAHRRLGHPRVAAARFRKALEIQETSEAPAAKASTLNALGLALQEQDQPEAARRAFEAALPIFQASRDRAGVARTHNNLGLVEHAAGRFESALYHYAQALDGFTDLGDRATQAVILNNLGGVYDLLGEWSQALDHYRRALPILETSGQRGQLAQTLNNLAVVYQRRGEWQKALDRFAQSQRIYRDLKDPAGVRTTEINRSALLASLGDSKGCLEGLSTVRSLPSTQPGPLAQEHFLKGRCSGLAGDWSAAFNSFARAREIRRDSADPIGESDALRAMGEAAEELGDGTAATRLLREGLRIARRIDYGAGILRCLQGLARTTRRRGEGSRAVELGLQALAVALEIGDLQAEMEIRHTLAQGLFELDRPQAASRQLDAALKRFESARSELVDPHLRTSYFATARDLYRLRIDRLMERHWEQPGGGFADQAFAVVERSRMRTLIERLSAAPGPGSQTRSLREPAETLGLRAVRERLLDDDTLFLAYSLGDRRSFLWAVTAERTVVSQLPGREALEAAVRELHRLWSTLDARDGPVQEAAAGDLSRTLLGPVAGLLEHRRLLIVPDGALHYLPFAALPEPAAGSLTAAAPEPLLAHHAINLLPSASVLAQVRERNAHRDPSADRQPRRDLAIFADPVFGLDDPRLLARQASTAIDSEHRFARPDLPRLLGSRSEALAIRDAAQGQDVWMALGFEASLQALEDLDVDAFRIFHFATHALVDEGNPERSGIALSLVDAAGQSRDGILPLERIYGLDIRADLVVLSACRTALGEEWDGEGLVGLTHGFLAAGASSVAATLWQVDDRATAEVMAGLYRNLLQEDLSPAAALRRSQLAVLHQRRWRDPYYWAPFVLVGDGFPEP